MFRQNKSDIIVILTPIERPRELMGASIALITID